MTGGDWGFRVGTGVGEGFQSEKITLSTNIWLYMYTHPLGYNWGGFRVGTGENHIVDKHMALYVHPPFRV